MPKTRRRRYEPLGSGSTPGVDLAWFWLWAWDDGCSDRGRGRRRPVGGCCGARRAAFSFQAAPQTSARPECSGRGEVSKRGWRRNNAWRSLGCSSETRNGWEDGVICKARAVRKPVKRAAAFSSVRLLYYWQFTKLSVGIGSRAASGSVTRFVGLQVLVVAVTE